MQSKLLRVLQEKTLERVGGTKPVPVYCRLIAATNKDLAALRARGEFREDLYYRLSTVTLKLPPLRDRARDIPALVRTFVEEANAAYGRSVKSIPDRIMRSLTTHAWPGNIRQLKNVIANAVILSDGEEISGLESGTRGSRRRRSPSTRICPARWPAIPREIEKKIIRSVLEKNQGNITKSATRLGISRKTLYEKIRQARARAGAGRAATGRVNEAGGDVHSSRLVFGPSRPCAFGGARREGQGHETGDIQLVDGRRRGRGTGGNVRPVPVAVPLACSSSTRRWRGGRGRTPRRFLPRGCRAAIPRTPSRSTPGTSSSIRGCVAGKMEPITFIFGDNGWLDRFPRGLIDIISYKGEIYSVPVNIHRSNVLWYNTRILAAAHMRPPQNLDELMSVCELLSRRGITPLALGDNGIWAAVHLLESVLLGSMGPERYRGLWTGDTRVGRSRGEAGPDPVSPGSCGT